MESGARSGAPGVAGVVGPGPAVIGRGVDVLEPAGDGAAAASPAESAMFLEDGARAVVWPAMVDEEDEVVVCRCDNEWVSVGWSADGQLRPRNSETANPDMTAGGRRQAADGRRGAVGKRASTHVKLLIFAAVLLFNRFGSRMIQLGEC